MERILIFGATSVLAQKTAELFAKEKASFVLIARNKDKLKAVADGLKDTGAKNVHEIVMDVCEADRYETVFNEATSVYGGLDLALVAHGVAHSQALCEKDIETTRDEIHINYTSTICLLMLLADYFERRGKGMIAVISSVSGDRGRRGQYLYASCKGGITVFLQGLRQRLYRSNVAVITLKPGLTDTPMTTHLKGLKRAKLFSSPERVAKGIFLAIRKRKAVAYLPWYWRHIMLVIKMIPENLFKKLNID